MEVDNIANADADNRNAEGGNADIVENVEDAAAVDNFLAQNRGNNNVPLAHPPPPQVQLPPQLPPGQPPIQPAQPPLVQPPRHSLPRYSHPLKSSLPRHRLPPALGSKGNRFKAFTDKGLYSSSSSNSSISITECLPKDLAHSNSSSSSPMARLRKDTVQPTSLCPEDRPLVQDHSRLPESTSSWVLKLQVTPSPMPATGHRKGSARVSLPLGHSTSPG
jgi:hypothetical protein